MDTREATIGGSRPAFTGDAGTGRPEPEGAGTISPAFGRGTRFGSPAASPCCALPLDRLDAAKVGKKGASPDDENAAVAALDR
jgi:hypothetical protein